MTMTAVRSDAQTRTLHEAAADLGVDGVRRRRRVRNAGMVVAGGLLVAALAVPAQGQIESAERNCIAAFTQGLAKVGKAHGKIVKQCTARFAKGSLVGETPEECIAS